MDALRRAAPDALVPGERDLARGLDVYLKRMAGLPVVAANLVDTASGKAPFPGHRLVRAAGIEVGVVGILDPDVFAGLPRVEVRPPVEAAQAAVKAAREAGAALVVLLAHMPFEVAEALLEQVSGVHLALAGHDGRPIARARRPGGAVLLATSDRGRHAGQLDVFLGPPPYRFVDAGKVSSLEREIAALDKQAERFREGIEEATSKAMRRYYERTLEGLKVTRAERVGELEAARGEPATGTRFRYRLIAMDDAWPDDPVTRKLVDACKTRLREIGAPVSAAHEKDAHPAE